MVMVALLNLPLELPQSSAGKTLVTGLPEHLSRCKYRAPPEFYLAEMK